MSLAGKVAIITGASSGIGEESARLFAAQGCKVVLAARRIEKLEQIVAEIKEKGGEAIAVATDVTEIEQIKNMFAKTMETYDKLDIPPLPPSALRHYARLGEQLTAGRTACRQCRLGRTDNVPRPVRLP
jgi:predicted amino acid dehydrogenase